MCPQGMKVRECWTRMENTDSPPRLSSSSSMEEPNGAVEEERMGTSCRMEWPVVVDNNRNDSGGGQRILSSRMRTTYIPTNKIFIAFYLFLGLLATGKYLWSPLISSSQIPSSLQMLKLPYHRSSGLSCPQIVTQLGISGLVVSVCLFTRPLVEHVLP